MCDVDSQWSKFVNFKHTVKLGYKDSGYNELMVNKILSFVLSHTEFVVTESVWMRKQSIERNSKMIRVSLRERDKKNVLIML